MLFLFCNIFSSLQHGGEGQLNEKYASSMDQISTEDTKWDLLIQILI